MWTTIEIPKSKIRKAYNKEYERAKAFLSREDDSTNWTVQYKDKQINVFESLVYIIARSARPDVENVIAESMTLKDVDTFNETIANKKKRGRFANSTTYVKADVEETNISRACRLSMGDNPMYAYMYNIIADFAKSKSSVIQDLMIEALIMASINIYRDNRLITPFTLQSAIYLYWYINTVGVSKRHGVATSPNDPINVVEKAKKVSLEEHIKSIVDDEEVYALVEPYLDEMADGTILIDAYFNNIENFIEVIKIEAKKSDDTKEYIDELENAIRDNNVNVLHPTVVKAIGKRNTRLAAYIMMSTSFIKEGSLRTHIGEPILLYFLKQYNDLGNTSVLNKNSIDLIDFCASEHSDYVCVSAEMATSSWPYWIMPDIINERDNITRQLDAAKKRIESVEQKAIDLRRQGREATKEVKRLTDENMRLKSKIDSLNKTVEGNIKPAELQAVQDKLNSSESKVQTLQDDIGEKTRQISKKAREISDLKEKLDKQEDDYLQLLEKYDRLKELNSQMSVHRVFNEIPIQCFINTIKTKRIILIGGDMMHEKIRLYGLDNITLCKAGCKDIDTEDVINKDLVVMATAFLDHSTSEIIPKLAKQNNVPLMQFNNKNADMLIYALFEELTK